MKNLILVGVLLFVMVGCTKTTTITAVDQTNRSYLIQPKNHTIIDASDVSGDSTTFWAHFDVTFDVTVDKNTVVEFTNYHMFDDSTEHVYITMPSDIESFRKTYSVINSNTLRFSLSYEFSKHKSNFNPSANLDSVSATIILSNPIVY